MTPEDEELQQFLNLVPKYEVVASQYADTRCVSRGVLSPDEKLFATSGWSGECKLWSLPDCNLVSNLSGHKDRVISIKFHPESTKTLPASSPANLASASADGNVRLWSLQSR